VDVERGLRPGEAGPLGEVRVEGPDQVGAALGVVVQYGAERAPGSITALCTDGLLDTRALGPDDALARLATELTGSDRENLECSPIT
jgi:hypothetical protein